ncbi:hypothetical protein E4U23_008641 [Claviceps purpurea]|nr:hypothetical protein E4U10_005041 [Claviceps purpurea]KAG6252600.1 hypothetical protein E4U23_008641 [Claviceps purpurea]KAG6307581.1 hypothetical protein E4U45_004167 [Claviceps purpurea]
MSPLTIPYHKHVFDSIFDIQRSSIHFAPELQRHTHPSSSPTSSLSVMNRMSVHVVIHQDDTMVTIAGIFASLSAANAACLRLCEEAGLQMEGTGDEEAGEASFPLKPLRWGSPEGIACWVETHEIA